MLAHIALFRRHGITPSPSLPPEELAAKRGWFWPQQLFLDVLAMAFCGALLVGLTTATHGAELYAPADPASNFVARPEWYFLSLFQLLKYFEGSLSIIATVLLPGAAAAFLVALPFVDRATARGGVGRPSGAVMAGVGTLIAGRGGAHRPRGGGGCEQRELSRGSSEREGPCRAGARTGPPGCAAGRGTARLGK